MELFIQKHNDNAQRLASHGGSNFNVNETFDNEFVGLAILSDIEVFIRASSVCQISESLEHPLVNGPIMPNCLLPRPATTLRQPLADMPAPASLGASSLPGRLPRIRQRFNQEW
ncbi:hypothetical protein [Burkholderia metallica]|uniref:hypothetical protein n=1 Tax=Burkholderia metallica TaxID=488729 RepID=UPI001CF40144|nr:hypothetical protein [Burkholderia metallica]MCA8003478.1 hypothetical protein [Burkholderia metallica]